MIILGATEYSIETITIEGLKKSKISTKSSSKSSSKKTKPAAVQNNDASISAGMPNSLNPYKIASIGKSLALEVNRSDNETTVVNPTVQVNNSVQTVSTGPSNSDNTETINEAAMIGLIAGGSVSVLIGCGFGLALRDLYRKNHMYN